MASSSKRENLDPPAEATPAESDQNHPETWWSKHASVLFIVGTLILVALVVAFNMK